MTPSIDNPVGVAHGGAHASAGFSPLTSNLGRVREVWTHIAVTEVGGRSSTRQTLLNSGPRSIEADASSKFGVRGVHDQLAVVKIRRRSLRRSAVPRIRFSRAFQKPTRLRGGDPSAPNIDGASWAARAVLAELQILRSTSGSCRRISNQ